MGKWGRTVHGEPEGLTEGESGECTERSDPKVLAAHVGREVVLTAALRSCWTVWCPARHGADFLRRLWLPGGECIMWAQGWQLGDGCSRSEVLEWWLWRCPEGQRSERFFGG